MAVDFHYSYDYEYDYEESKLRHSKDSSPQSTVKDSRVRSLILADQAARREEGRSNRKSNAQSSSTRSSKCSRERNRGDGKNKDKREGQKPDDRWSAPYRNERKHIGILDCTKKSQQSRDEGLKKFGQGTRTCFMDQVIKHPVYGEKAVPPGDLSNAVYPCEARCNEIEGTFAEAAISHVFNCRTPKPGQMNSGRMTNDFYAVSTSAKSQLEEVRSGFTAIHHRTDATIPGMRGYENYIRWKNGMVDSFLDDSDFSTEATDEDITDLKESNKFLLIANEEITITTDLKESNKSILGYNSDFEGDEQFPLIVNRDGAKISSVSSLSDTSISSTSSLSTSDDEQTTIVTEVTEVTTIEDEIKDLSGPIVSIRYPSNSHSTTTVVEETIVTECDDSVPRVSATTIREEIMTEFPAGDIPVGCCPLSSVTHEVVPKSRGVIPVSTNRSSIISYVSGATTTSGFTAQDGSIHSVNAGDDWRNIHYSGVSDECPYTIRTKRIEEGAMKQPKNTLIMDDMLTMAPSSHEHATIVTGLNTAGSGSTITREPVSIIPSTIAPSSHEHATVVTGLGGPSIATRGEDGYTTTTIVSSSPGAIQENTWTVEAEDITLGNDRPSSVHVELPMRTTLADMGPRPDFVGADTTRTHPSSVSVTEYNNVTPTEVKTETVYMTPPSQAKSGLGSIRISSAEEHSGVGNYGFIHGESYTGLGGPSIVTRGEDGYTTTTIVSSSPGAIQENTWTVEAEDITLGYDRPSSVHVELPMRTTLADMGPRPDFVGADTTRYVDSVDFDDVPLVITEAYHDSDQSTRPIQQYFVGEIIQPSERIIAANHVQEYVPLPLGVTKPLITNVQRHDRPMIQRPHTPLVIFPAGPNYPLVPELVMSESQSVFEGNYTGPRLGEDSRLQVTVAETSMTADEGIYEMSRNVDTVDGDDYDHSRARSMTYLTNEESSSLESVSNLQSIRSYSRTGAKKQEDFHCMNQC